MSMKRSDINIVNERINGYNSQPNKSLPCHEATHILSESGPRTHLLGMPVRELRRIAEALGVDIHQLICKDDIADTLTASNMMF